MKWLLLAATIAAAPASSQPTAGPAGSAQDIQAKMAAALADARQGATAKALKEAGEARDLARQAGDVADQGVATLYAAVLNASSHTPDGNARASDLFRSARPLLAATGNIVGQATASQGLGDSLAALGRLAEAAVAYKAALPLMTAPGQAPQHARTLTGLALVERALGKLEESRAHVEAALRLLDPADKMARTTALMQLGMVCDDLSDWGCGTNAFLSAAEAGQGGPYPDMRRQALNRGALDAERDALRLGAAGKPAEAAARTARAANAFHAVGDTISESMALLASGRYRSATGDWAAAEAAQEAALASAQDDASRESALLALASTAERRGSHQRALERAEAALPLLASPQKAGQRALAWLIAGNAAAGVHDNGRALRDLAEAQALGTVNPGVRAAALAAEGEIRTEQGDPDRGAALAREAQRLHEQLGNEGAANKDRGDLGLALAARGRRSEALAVFEASLAAARRSGDAQQQAATLSNIGTVRLAFGDFAQAAALFKKAQEAAHSAGDRDVEATATNKLGMTYFAQGKDEEAFGAIRAAMVIRRDAGDRRGEAITKSDLALVENETGHAQEALDLYAQLRAQFHALSDTYHEAVSLNGLGTVYRRLGALDEARRYYERAKELHERSHDEESLSVVLNNLGVVEQTAGETDDAMKDYQRALAIQTALGGRAEQVTLLNGIAFLREPQAKNSAALADLARALSLAEQLGSLGAQALTLHNRGTLLELDGDQAGALKDLRRALPLWQELGAAHNEAITRGVIARIEAAQGHTEDALAHAQAAIGLWESQRAEVASGDLRASWLAQASRVYELRTDLLMELDARRPGRGYAARALEATEAGRARSLLDVLRVAHIDVLRHANPAQAERLRGIRYALGAKALQRAKLGSDSPDGKALAQDIDNLLAEAARVETATRSSNPAYASLTAPAPLSATSMQALLDQQTVLLDFALGDKRSFVWLVTPETLRVYSLPPRAAVLKAVKSVRDAIAGQSNPDSFRALGAMLLGPVAPAIKSKRLVVIGDPELEAGTPFAALTVPSLSAEQGQPLVQSHEVVVEPSMAALASIRQATARRLAPAGAIAIFADPVVSSRDQRLASTGNSGALSVDAALDLPRLPATRAEADAILSVPPPGRALTRFGFDATREAAEDPGLTNYAILHFAVHGATDVRSPQLSGLVLSMRSPDGTPRNGYLRLADIYGLSLPTRLVVLSACGSGLGKVVAGEGIVGLSRGFLYSGAATVVATLWDIQDDSTATLMTGFYQGLWGPQHLQPSAALREAQRSMIADGKWTAPRFWAGFTVQGEWR